MSHDVVVVGAGIGGLTAAVELAARGLRVVVVEASHDIGGKAGVVWLDGIEVDTGPSLLTLPDVFDGILRRGGSSLRDEVELLEPDPWFEYRWPDGARLVVRHTREDTLAEVTRSFGARASRSLSDYLDHAARIWTAAAPTFVTGPAPSLRRVASLGLRALPLLAAIEPLTALRASIRARVREPHLVTLLERYATYNGSDPRRAPATLGCIAHVELTLGGFGIRGGVRSLVEALARVARRLGVEIRLGARVASIRTAKDRVEGVELEAGERLVAPSVVANADPTHVLGELVEGSRPPRAAPSMSGWNAIVRTARAPRAAHTVLFSADYDAELRDIFEHGRPPADPTVYVCAPGVAHARPGWSSDEPLFVMTNAAPEPRQGESPRAVWSATRERVRARLARDGVTAASDPLLWERTPSDLARAFPGTRGAIYGTSSSSMASAFLRPSNTVRGQHGLYLASGGAHPGGGMPLAALSGVQAARALVADRDRGLFASRPPKGPSPR
jgi:phytoene desaturase